MSYIKPITRPIINWGSPQANGLVHAFPFWEGAGWRVGNLVNPAHHGAFDYGGSGVLDCFWGQGPLGRGLWFDGQFFNNKVSIPQILLPGPLSISAWITPTFTNATGKQIWAKVVHLPTTSIADPYDLYAIGFDNSSPAKISCYISTGAGGSGVGVTTSWGIAPYTTYHTVMTYDLSTLTFWVNGVNQGQSSTSITVGTSSTQDTIFGIYPSGTVDNAYLGWIYDVRFYNRALRPSEVQAMYAQRSRWDLYAPAKVRQWGITDTPASTIAYRRSLSFLGSRGGSRQGA